MAASDQNVPIVIAPQSHDDMFHYASYRGVRLHRYISAARDGDVLWNADERDASPAVFCECGSDTFRISYGSYECFAECSACGRKGSIYSG